MVDSYFKRPVFWDCILASSGIILAWLFLHKGYIILPSLDRLFSTVSDMSTISLTMAGFVLTLVTVFISFKSTIKVDANASSENTKVFYLFFASRLYYQTMKILNNAIKSLAIIALLGYFLKLILLPDIARVLYFYCVAGAIIIMLTVFRSAFILTTIVKMQEDSSER